MISPRAMGRLLRDLESPDGSVRRNAAVELSGADERAVYPLIKALRDESPGVQEAAMRSLVAIGGEVVSYMVIPLLREDSLLRNAAVLILKELGRISVPLLYPLLKDKDADVRKFAVELLGDIKEDVLPEKMLSALDDPNANVKAAGLKAIGDLMYEKAAPLVLKALGDEEWVCFSALDTMGRLKDEGAVGPVSALLESGSQALRLAAIETLGLIGSRLAADALLRHAQRSAGDEKTASIKSLIQIGANPSMSEVSDVLVSMLEESRDWDEKLIAVKGLADVGAKHAVKKVLDVAGSLDRSVPGEDELLMAIEDSLLSFGCAEGFREFLRDPESRFKGKVVSAEVIGLLGCEESAPELVSLLRTDSRDVRRACVKALGMLKSPQATQALKGLLGDHDSHIRKSAASALGARGEREAFDDILERLGAEEYQDVVEACVKALLEIDPKGLFTRMGGLSPEVRAAVGKYSDEVDILVGLSRDPDLSVRLSAIVGLGKLQEETTMERLDEELDEVVPSRKAVLPRKAQERLREALGDSDPAVRRTAAMALGGSGACRGELTALLKDGDMWVRLHAVRALGENRDGEALKKIAPLLEDPELPVVLAAVGALGEIGGEEAAALARPLLSHPEPAVREAAARALVAE